MKLGLLDSTGVIWWVQITPTGDLTTALSPPPAPSEPVVLGSPVPWLQVTSNNGTVWYITVTVLGDIQTTRTPPTGTGDPLIQGRQLYDTTGQPWSITVTATGDVQLIAGTLMSALTSYEDSAYTRFCPIHRLPHDPDPRIYRDAGRACPCGGERLIGYLARFRDEQGLPGDAELVPWNWVP
jgi:hypothetical protein